MGMPVSSRRSSSSSGVVKNQSTYLCTKTYDLRLQPMNEQAINVGGKIRQMFPYASTALACILHQSKGGLPGIVNVTSAAIGVGSERAPAMRSLRRSSSACMRLSHRSMVIYWQVQEGIKRGLASTLHDAHREPAP
jgi:hypothetical protein